MSIFSVEGRICCITGAGRGIGHMLARSLSDRGASVIGIDLEFPDEDEFFEHRIKLDLSVPGEVWGMFGEIQSVFERIDVLVNCAGVTKPSEGEYPYEKWKDTFSVNVDAAFLVTKSLLPLLEKSKSPSVINITSINESLGFPNNPAYVSSKAALSGLTRSQSVDLGIKNVRVNSIAPGYFKTDMTGESWADEEKRRARSDRTSLGRWGEVDELVGPMIFLASEASSYVTGHSLFVDGGWTTKGL